PLLQLMAPPASTWAAALTDSAILLRDSAGYQTVGASDLQLALRDSAARDHFLRELRPKANPPMGRIEAGVRHLARTVSWSTPRNAVLNFVKPRAVAAAHNALLVSMARGSKCGVRFRHADQWLNDALKTGSPALAGLAKQAAELLANALPPPEGLSEALAVAYRQCLLGIFDVFAQRAERDLSALSAFSMPEEIWTGSFGQWHA